MQEFEHSPYKITSNNSTWSEEVIFTQQDLFLIEMIKEFGERKWSAIAKLFNQKFPNRDKTGKQCRERWHNHLDPNLVKESFTLEDEIKVFEYQKKFGNKWSEIAACFEGRNDNFVKNCFYSAIRRNLRKYNRDKVPSKQLKGTINKLLRNSRTQKILMNFPEHENFDLGKQVTSRQKIVPAKEMHKIEKPVPQYPYSNSENFAKIFEIKLRPEPLSGKNKQKRPKSVKNLDCGELAHEESEKNSQVFQKPCPQILFPKEFVDLASKLNYTSQFPMNFGIWSDDRDMMTNVSSNRHSFISTLGSLDSKRTSFDAVTPKSTKSEISPKFTYKLPDFSPKNTFQYHTTPRCSK